MINQHDTKGQLGQERILGERRLRTQRQGERAEDALPEGEDGRAGMQKRRKIRREGALLVKLGPGTPAIFNSSPLYYYHYPVLQYYTTSGLLERVLCTAATSL